MNNPLTDTCFHICFVCATILVIIFTVAAIMMMYDTIISGLKNPPPNEDKKQ